MSLYYFVLGFFSAFAAGAALIFFAGAKTRPLLAERLEKLREERKTTRAKAVKAALSVDKFKVTSIEAVVIQATPAHISTAGVPCRLAMIGGAITLSTAHALRAASSSSQQPASSPSNPDEPKPRPQDRAIATFSAKNITCTMDKKNRCVLHLAPKPGVSHICEVTDTINGESKTVQWRALSFAFEGGAREADRWYTVLNQNPAAERWLKFTKSIPEGAATSFNLFVARILFENSAGPTLDEFISAKIRKKLAHVSLPPPLAGQLQLLDLHFGDDSPFFTNTSFTGFASTGEFGFDLDLLYRGGLTLVLSVTLQIGPLKVPNLVLEIKIGQVKGRLHMSIGGPPSNKMWVGFHEQPELSLELKQDIHLPPEAKFIASAIRGMDISEIVSEVVKTKLFEDMILPVMDDLPIPDLGPTPPSSPTTPAANPVAHAPQLSDWTDVAPETQGKPTKVDAPAAKTTTPAQAAKPAAPAATTPPAKPQSKAEAEKQLEEHLSAKPKQPAQTEEPTVVPKDLAQMPPSRRERIEHEVEEKAAELRHAAHEVRDKVAKMLAKARTPTSSPPPEAAAAAGTTPPKTQPNIAQPTDAAAPAAAQPKSEDSPSTTPVKTKAATEEPSKAQPAATEEHADKPLSQMRRNSGSNDSIAAPGRAGSSGHKSPPSVPNRSPDASGSAMPPPAQPPRPASSASDGSWVKDVSHTAPPPYSTPPTGGRTPNKEDVLSGEPMTRADTNPTAPADPAAAAKQPQVPPAHQQQQLPPSQFSQQYVRPKYAQSQPQW